MRPGFVQSVDLESPRQWERKDARTSRQPENRSTVLAPYAHKSQWGAAPLPPPKTQKCAQNRPPEHLNGAPVRHKSTTDRRSRAPFAAGPAYPSLGLHRGSCEFLESLINKGLN